MEGVDYAYGFRTGLGAALKAADKQFACRYLSGGSQKDLTKAEIADLTGAGVAVVVVFETDGKTGPLMGAAGGQMDARAAVAQAQSLGIPANACIYFAVDFGATSGNAPALQAYFEAARAICHAAGYRCGDYGGLATVTGEHGHVDCEWQTYAWSGGNWDGSANVEQYLNGQSICGITADLDRAITADFGQFPTITTAEGVTVQFQGTTKILHDVFINHQGHLAHRWRDVSGADSWHTEDLGAPPNVTLSEPSVAMDAAVSVQVVRALGSDGHVWVRYAVIPGTGWGSWVTDPESDASGTSAGSPTGVSLAQAQQAAHDEVVKALTAGVAGA